ncbi:mitochondrial carrier [Auricularia subglabra TFB-10046 SS5]|nr:mitochondrial carrier [Auricularia subglabra TFB-10046 SS5]
MSDKSPKVSRSLATGLVSGFTSTLVLQPFDFLKTQLQQNDAPPGIRAVVARSGVWGLWRGTVPTLWRNVPGIALYFTAFTQLRPVLARVPALQNNGRLSSFGDALAGATTRVGVGFLLNPLAVVKARVESQRHAYSSLLDGLRSLAREGPRGLFRGAGVSALRDAPYAGVYMATYQRLKLVGAQFGALADSHTVINTLSAASAAAFAGIVTHPFDVLKTRIQVRDEARYRSIRSAIVYIWKTRGVRGFFDGLTLRFGRKMAGSTIAWVVYEAILDRWQ